MKSAKALATAPCPGTTSSRPRSDRRRLEALTASAGEIARGAHGEQRRFPLFARGYRRPRCDAQPEDAVAEPKDTRGGTQAPGRRSAGAGERLAGRARRCQPAKSLEEIKDDAAAGILLDEASQIAADLAVATARRAAPTQARRPSCTSTRPGACPSNDRRQRGTPHYSTVPIAAAACTSPSNLRPTRSSPVARLGVLPSSTSAAAGANESAVGTVSALLRYSQVARRRSNLALSARGDLLLSGHRRPAPAARAACSPRNRHACRSSSREPGAQRPLWRAPPAHRRRRFRTAIQRS